MAAPKQKMTFMEKLQHILSTADVELVSWAPNGLSFYVFDADRWVFRNEHPPALAAVAPFTVSWLPPRAPQVLKRDLRDVQPHRQLRVVHSATELLRYVDFPRSGQLWRGSPALIPSATVAPGNRRCGALLPSVSRRVRSQVMHYVLVYCT